MTLEEWLHSEANDVDEVIVFDKDHRPLMSWTDDDPKYNAEVTYCTKGDTCAIVQIDWTKGE